MQKKVNIIDAILLPSLGNGTFVGFLLLLSCQYSRLCKDLLADDKSDCNKNEGKFSAIVTSSRAYVRMRKLFLRRKMHWSHVLKQLRRNNRFSFEW